ncbi:fimbrial protein [Escherichia coli]|uniref:fimbrial protein n=1 Tax=Escherichia coli TaxID=562 RepID=UPI00235893FB|nr:fimbrial protein [Escherichia coli]MDC9041834.1 fimbrial protein [Escherichia coli]
MPETTVSEMQSANNTKSGSIDLVLNCDSVYNVTTNPVTFKVTRGEWDDSGTILKNTSLNGAKGVGFQIYNGNATTPLKLGDTLMNKLTKMAAIENQYTFPITAKYVRVKEEALQPEKSKAKPYLLYPTTSGYGNQPLIFTYFRRGSTCFLFKVHQCEKKPVLSYELFFKDGGEGGFEPRYVAVYTLSVMTPTY